MKFYYLWYHHNNIRTHIASNHCLPFRNFVLSSIILNSRETINISFYSFKNASCVYTKPTDQMLMFWATLKQNIYTHYTNITFFYRYTKCVKLVNWLESVLKNSRQTHNSIYLKGWMLLLHLFTFRPNYSYISTNATLA